LLRVRRVPGNPFAVVYRPSLSPRIRAHKPWAAFHRGYLPRLVLRLKASRRPRCHRRWRWPHSAPAGTGTRGSSVFPIIETLPSISGPVHGNAAAFTRAAGGGGGGRPRIADFCMRGKPFFFSSEGLRRRKGKNQVPPRAIPSAGSLTSRIRLDVSSTLRLLDFFPRFHGTTAQAVAKLADKHRP